MQVKDQDILRTIKQCNIGGQMLTATDKVNKNSPIEERILEAAEQLFAEHGFRGASLRDITDAAGCNVAAVNYHFHGKENLYIAVFQRHMKAVTTERLLGMQEAFAQAGNTSNLIAFLHAFVDVFLRPFFNSEQGQLTSKLVMQERQDPHLPRQMFFHEVVDPLHDIVRKPLMALCPYLTLEQANQCMHSLVGQAIYTLHAQTLFAGTVETAMPLLNIEKTVNHIIRFTAAGIRQYNEQDAG